MPLTPDQQALLWAIRYRQPEKVKALLAKKTLVLSFPDPVETTPMHEAVKVSNLPIIRMLVDAGADVNQKAKNGTTPLDAALRINNAPVIRFLKSQSAKTAGELGNKQKVILIKPTVITRPVAGDAPSQKPAFTADTLADVFEPGKWVNNVKEMQELWKQVPPQLKDKFNFAAALTEARQKTLKQRATGKVIIKKPPDPPIP